jgi:hypothetical protein
MVKISLIKMKTKLYLKKFFPMVDIILAKNPVIFSSMLHKSFMMICIIIFLKKFYFQVLVQ